ncbi:MAG: N-formylglutamate amidohydrolase [Leptospiraceae bacterium]|nr:N-formylglutamate amidohydrolase [Leptospiraceae bacterium]
MSASNQQIVITVEHASNFVPEALLKYFKFQKEILDSHRAYDKFTSIIADNLSKRLQAPCIVGRNSRLICDLNRSLHSRTLFSEFVKDELTQKDKEKLIFTYYSPFRKKTRDTIEKIIEEQKSVLHLSIHSFNPELNINRQNVELGLLYDPSREAEKQFALNLRRFLAQEFQVRLNFPYRGTDDGHTTALRKVFKSDDYLGIELEFNHGLPDTRIFDMVDKIYSFLSSQ